MADQKELAMLPREAGRLRVRSAMYPMIWISGVIGIPSIIALGWGDHPALAVSITLYSVVGVALLGFLYLLLCDPDRLQTKIYLVDLADAKSTTQQTTQTTD